MASRSGAIRARASSREAPGRREPQVDPVDVREIRDPDRRTDVWPGKLGHARLNLFGQARLDDARGVGHVVPDPFRVRRAHGLEVRPQRAP